MDEIDKLIEQAASDAIIGKPMRFTLGNERYDIHPPQIGKIEILSKLFLQLEFDEDALVEYPFTEMMRICANKADLVCQIMAIATLRTKEEVLDDDLVQERADHFKWSCENKDYAKCVIAIMSMSDYENFIVSTRLMKMLRLNKPTATKRADRVE